MSIDRPFHKNYRAVKQGVNSGYSGWAYIVDKEYAKSPEHYIRAFYLIESDLKKLFEYVEPSNESIATFSYRIHELLMRTCIEIEANFKAILAENTYTPKKDSYKNPILNIGVYKKVDVSHHLSSYQVSLPIWNGGPKLFEPFKSWAVPKARLSWYQAYNESKHDRHESFKKANFGTLVEAIAGLLVLLSSQFGKQNFSTGGTLLSVNVDEYHEMESALGGLFRIRFPDDWSDEEIYEFDWTEIKNEPDRFRKFDYDAIP